MKKLNAVTLAGFALCGFLLGMKALGLAEAGITLLLIVWGGYAYGAAAARAPLVLYAVLGTAAALGMGNLAEYLSTPAQPAAQDDFAEVNEPDDFPFN